MAVRGGYSPFVRLGQGGGSSETCPFDMTISGDTLTFRPGTVNNILPSNIFEEITWPSESEEAVMVKIQISTNGQAVTGAEIVVNTTAPESQEPTPFYLPSSFEVLIYVIYNGVATRIISCGSLSFYGTEQFRISPEPAAVPGQMTYQPYMIWA